MAELSGKMTQDVLLFPMSIPDWRNVTQNSMNCTIRRDLCHSHRTQHKGSRILARASRAQFGLGIQVVFVAYLSANFLVRHSDADPSSTESGVSRAILHPKSLSIRSRDHMTYQPHLLRLPPGGHQVCPDIRCSCLWISYRILRTAESSPNQPKEREKKNEHDLCLV